MKIIKIILKGILLYVTTTMILLFVSGVDSIYDAGYFIPGILVCAVLCYLCYKFISERELEILSGFKWLDKKLGSGNDFKVI